MQRFTKERTDLKIINKKIKSAKCQPRRLLRVPHASYDPFAVSIFMARTVVRNPAAKRT